MINPLKLYQKLQPYKVTDEKFLPINYQTGHQPGPLHSDWPPGLQWVKRIDTAYMVPQPMKLLEGNMKMVLKPYQKDYPLVPGTKLIEGFNNSGALWVYNSTAAIGETNTWGRFAVWLTDEWVECFYTSTTRIFGKDILTYRGLKFDFDPANWMGWFPEASWSIQKGE